MKPKKFKRIFVIVMDSVGIGAEPDAEAWGDKGSNTIVHLAERAGGVSLPVLQSLGYGNLTSIPGVAPAESPKGYYTKAMEASNAKDTLIGHWEIMGLKVAKPFKTFTEQGFPPELIDELSRQTGHQIIGNRAASGTEIIKELGEREMRTGEMIVYTSGDSVLQICGNEKTFDLKELYRCCEIARKITMRDEWKVGRVIARPYVGTTAADFVRTSNRRDYAVDPAGETVLDTLTAAGWPVIAVGKIRDIFNGKGISESFHSNNNADGMRITTDLSRRKFKKGLCFVNLVDFDALWGHRRNPIGYARSLEEFDQDLKGFLETLRTEDLLVLTADHGNDPTWTGTDHTREMVPMIFYSPAFTGAGLLPLARTFANIGATIADNFRVKAPKNGESYLELLK